MSKSLIEQANSLARELQNVLAQAFGPKVQFHFIVGTESFSLTVGDKNEIKWSRSHPTDPGSLVGAARDAMANAESTK